MPPLLQFETTYLSLAFRNIRTLFGVSHVTNLEQYAMLRNIRTLFGVSHVTNLKQFAMLRNIRTLFGVSHVTNWIDER